MSEPRNIRSQVLHDISLDDIAAMERWYHQLHIPEIVRRYGPWQARFESYLPVAVPPEARQFGLYNWRLTDGWWRELPKAGAQGTFCFTDPPLPPRVATCFIPWQPTEDFLGADHQPRERDVLRWYLMLKYPPGVSQTDGEAWFLGTHVPELLKQPGLIRAFSYRTVQEGVHLPGTWRAGSAPKPGMVERGWDRVIELWYENFRDWRRAVLESPPRYTAPAWATRAAWPFVEPGRDLASTFLLERPNDEFLRDSRIFVP